MAESYMEVSVSWTINQLDDLDSPNANRAKMEKWCVV